MDIKEFIKSGNIELYAMKALSPQETTEFERNLMLYPEIAKELKKVQSILEMYAASHSSNPRPAMRVKVLEAIEASTEKSKKKKIKAKDRSNDSLTYKYLIAASLAALIVSTFASWFFFTRWGETEEKYTELLNDQNELAQNYNLVKGTYDQTLNNLLVLRDGNSQIHILKSTEGLNNYQARVYWNTQTNNTYIDVLFLPQPDAGMQYQLWAEVDGKYINAGVIPGKRGGVQRVRNIEKADDWIVTQEGVGGSELPSMEKIILRTFSD